jgi:hypothetical protein
LAYVITPGCTGPNGEQLALGAAPDGSIVVQDAAEVTDSIVWSLLYDIPSGNVALLNADSAASGTPSILCLVSDDKTTTPLQLVTYDDGLLPDRVWNIAPGGSALAVRSGLSTSLNLNVAGTGPYPPGSKVIAYDGWGGGQPNEIWTFNQFGSGPYPWYYTFEPMNAPGTLLSADPQNAGGQLTIQSPQGSDLTASPAQLWIATLAINGTAILGPVFWNAELEMALATTPGGGAVFCADLDEPDEWSSWIVPPAPDPQAYALWAVGNQKLALNVSGGGSAPGTVVITWPWQGGAENEQWVPTFVPHEVT